MERVTIRNFGNIQEVILDLKRFNVIIGPQSSGKSTIAKVLSYCYWLEKKFISNLGNYEVTAEQFWLRLCEFHNMTGYQMDNSNIEYESEFISFSASKTKFSSNLKKDFIKKYVHYKVSYIPSERNVVTLPGLEKFTLPDNNLRSFLFDWYDARKMYPKDKSVDILDLNMKYYFSDSQSLPENHIVSNSKNPYDILLCNASSGIQSLVPLLLMLDYYGDKIYNQGANELSYIQNESNVKIIKKLIDSYLENELNIFNAFTKEGVNISNNSKIDQLTSRTLRKISEIVKRTMKPHFTHFIIEEPEQNLFPTTQKELIYYLMKIQKSTSHGHSFTITTHSPYILATFNLLLFATKVANKSEENKIQINEVFRDLSLDVDSFGAYYLNTVDGKVELVDLVNKKTGMISQNELDSVSEEISHDFNMIYDMYAKSM